MHFEFKMFPLKQQVLKCVHICFHRPRTESWWNKWPPSQKEKSLTGQEAPYFCPNNRTASGSHTDGLHCFHTVNVSLLCFFIAIDSDRFLTGNNQKPTRGTRGSVIESKKSFSACQDILTIFWQLFPLEWYVWLENWALTFTNCQARAERITCKCGWLSVALVLLLHYF